MKWLERMGAHTRDGTAEPAQAVIEYVLVLVLFAVTALGVITAFGSEISVSSSAIATHVFSAG